MTKHTKVVCTIGPASSSVETLIKLFDAGMTVARLNFSHGTHEDHLKSIKNIRTACTKTGHNVAIMQDLQGPKIRLGILPSEGVPVKEGEPVIFDTGSSKYELTKEGTPIIPVQYKNLHQDVKAEDIILIEDGLLATQVVRIKGTQIFAKATRDCLFKSHKGINVPTASISADPLTAKDIKDLKFGLENDVDYVALSFVRKGSDIKKLRNMITKQGSKARIIAKVERHEALTNIEDIVTEADAIMVARGDLGVETPAEEVPLAQKMITKAANKYGKPVIVATEMLQSMIEKPRATRAEVSDAANAVFGHADALMLSNETAVGKYPLEAVQTLSKVSMSVEAYQAGKEKLLHHQEQIHLSDTDEVCVAAASLAQQVNAKAIVAVTHSGYTARHIAKQRTFTNIISITDEPQVKRQLALVWGINTVLVSKAQEMSQIKSLLTKQKLVKTGDKIILVSNAGSANKYINFLQF